MDQRHLRLYCAECGLKQLSPMDMQRNPFKDKAEIRISKNVSKPDPRNPENVIRVMEHEVYTQEPAMICTGCYEDFIRFLSANLIYK